MTYYDIRRYNIATKWSLEKHSVSVNAAYREKEQWLFLERNNYVVKFYESSAIKLNR